MLRGSSEAQGEKYWNLQTKFATLSTESGRQVGLGVRLGDLERSAFVARYRRLRCRVPDKALCTSREGDEPLK